MDPQVVFPAMLAIIVGLIVVPVVLFALVDSLRSRQVTCPHGGELVKLRLGPGHLAAAALVGARQRARACSRWPEQAGCDRACELTVT